MVSLLLILPSFVLAADDSFSKAIFNLSNLIKTLTGLAFSLAFLAFFWGLFKYLGTNAEEEKKEGMRIIATSIVVVFVMLSIWGLIKLLKNTLSISDTSADSTVNFPVVKPDIN